MCCYTVLCLELILNLDRCNENKMMIMVIFILMPGTFIEWLWLLCTFNLRGPLHSQQQDNPMTPDFDLCAPLTLQIQSGPSNIKRMRGTSPHFDHCISLTFQNHSTPNNTEMPRAHRIQDPLAEPYLTEGLTIKPHRFRSSERPPLPTHSQAEAFTSVSQVPVSRSQCLSVLCNLWVTVSVKLLPLRFF